MKNYLKSLLIAEEMWEWLCDNPGKQKYHWPKYDSLLADSLEDCTVCDYRKEKHDGHFFCNGKSYLSIEPCFLASICLEYQANFSACGVLETRREYAEKVYFAILEERLRVTQNDKVYFPVREMWDARKYRGPSSIRSTGEKIT